MKKYILSLVLILTITLSSAQYITGDIYIDDTGKSRFYIDTDINPNIDDLNFEDNRLTGTTEMFSSKSQGIWTFEIDLETYETILVDIHLPKNLQIITSIEGVENFFDIESKVVSLIDNDNDLEFEVSYTLSQEQDFSLLYFAAIVIILILAILLFTKRKIKNSKIQHILPIINDNEKRIVELLMKKPMRQKEIRKILDIPKASYSRYLIHLEKKKLILRQGEGKNKMVRLK